MVAPADRIEMVEMDRVRRDESDGIRKRRKEAEGKVLVVTTHVAAAALGADGEDEGEDVQDEDDGDDDDGRHDRPRSSLDTGGRRRGTDD
jgi:hypothetical protein